MIMKICNTCKVEKPEEDFYRYKGGRCSKCKLCAYEWQRQYNKNHPELKLDYNRQWREKLKNEKGRVLDWIKNKYEGTPCMDCGRVFIWFVMDWDHRSDEVKEFIISLKGPLKATPDRLAQVMKEIAKCDLVCANCHRIRTYSCMKVTNLGRKLK